MDFYKQLLDHQTRLKSKKQNLSVTIFGSYDSPIKDILRIICQTLQTEGYNTGLVEDYPSHGFNPDHKSIFYIETSNVNLIYFFKDTDNQSVAREVSYILDNPNLIGKSIFFEEKEPYDEFGAIRTLINTRLTAKNIRTNPFNKTNVYKLTKKTLIDFLY